MTPLEAGGQNGGAGLVATALVRHMSALAPDACLTLLTADDSHAELATLDRPNVRRQLVAYRSHGPSPTKRLANRVLPTSLRVRASRAYHSLRSQGQSGTVVEALKPDLIFCPFTVPRYWHRGVPCVSIVYDLQHVAYPQHFTAEQRLNRQHHIEQAVARSDRVVCISEYVRQTLLANTACPPERAPAIPLGQVHEPTTPDPTILDRLGLRPDTFLLYPANFWPHKNHRRLFDALRQSRSQLRLVCTGAPNSLMRTLHREVPAERVQFAGYVNDAELAALLETCAALVFPSLYEGFGLPILEAMARGKPVLCSDLGSLREVGGDCPVYFDPLDSTAIAAAIDTSPSATRAECGRTRAAQLGDSQRMASDYLDLFSEVLSAHVA
jgi:glycosyltransferase involved in cell wall biosynthesis